MATAAYTAPGLTIAECETLVGDATGLATTAASATLTKIDQAITLAGQAACTWDGRDWWFLNAWASFKTTSATVAALADSGAQRATNVATITTTAVHGLAAGQAVAISGVSDSTFDGTHLIITAPSTTTLTYANEGDDVGAATAGGGTVYVPGYPLRTVNSAAMTDLFAIRQVWRSTSQLAPYPGGYNQYRLDIHQEGLREGTPVEYAVGAGMNLWLHPTPDTAYVITVDYLRRHSEITSAGSSEAALIIPAEYHMDIYVEGAIWLLRHEKVDTASLAQCPGFVSGIQRMAAAAPSEYDDSASGGPVIPDGQHVIVIDDS